MIFVKPICTDEVLYFCCCMVGQNPTYTLSLQITSYFVLAAGNTGRYLELGEKSVCVLCQKQNILANEHHRTECLQDQEQSLKSLSQTAKDTMQAY